MTKCEICNKEFEAEGWNRKYCDKCEKMTIKELQEDAEAKREVARTIIDNRVKATEEIEKSAEYKKLKAEMKELGKILSKTRDKINNRAEEIRVKYHTGTWSPSHSQTYGKNIHWKVISAIQKTFKWKRLAGSTVEKIVRNMVEHDMRDDKQLKNWKDKQSQKQWDERKLDDKRSELKKPLEKFSTELFNIQNQIESMEKLIADKSLEENSDADLKTVDKYNRGRALKKYRQQSIDNYEKVFENLGDI